METRSSQIRRTKVLNGSVKLGQYKSSTRSLVEFDPIAFNGNESFIIRRVIIVDYLINLLENIDTCVRLDTFDFFYFSTAGKDMTDITDEEIFVTKFCNKKKQSLVAQLTDIDHIYVALKLN